MMRSDGAKITIPPSGDVLRIVTEYTGDGELLGIPICDVVNDSYNGISYPLNPDTTYIVSTFAAMAMRLPNVVSPDTGKSCKRDERGRVEYSVRFQRFYSEE